MVGFGSLGENPVCSIVSLRNNHEIITNMFISVFGRAHGCQPDSPPGSLRHRLASPRKPLASSLWLVGIQSGSVDVTPWLSGRGFDANWPAVTQVQILNLVNCYKQHDINPDNARHGTVNNRQAAASVWCEWRVLLKQHEANWHHHFDVAVSLSEYFTVQLKLNCISAVTQEPQTLNSM